MAIQDLFRVEGNRAWVTGGATGLAGWRPRRLGVPVPRVLIAGPVKGEAWRLLQKTERVGASGLSAEGFAGPM